MNPFSPLKRALAHRPVATFLLIATQPDSRRRDPAPTATEIPPFDLPLFAMVGCILGVALGAFAVTAATAGRADVTDLLRRSFRWRVPARLVSARTRGAAFAGRSLPQDDVGGHGPLFVLELVLFQMSLARVTGWIPVRLPDERELELTFARAARRLLTDTWGRAKKLVVLPARARVVRSTQSSPTGRAGTQLSEVAPSKTPCAEPSPASAAD